MAKVAIDLGTANTLVMIEGQGIVVNEPTVVAYTKRDLKIVAVGKEAKAMIGKVPEGVVVKRPLQRGVIASYRLTEALLRHVLKKALGRFRFIRPEIMVSVPAGLTSVEKRAVKGAIAAIGASKIYLLPEPIAAAIGTNMPISSSYGNMIINMGGGTSEIAVISLNGLVKYMSKRVSGDAFNAEIKSYLEKEHDIVVGELMAERVKMKIANAVEVKGDDIVEMIVDGRDSKSGQPISRKLTNNDLIVPTNTVLRSISDAAKNILEQTPPELASDIVDRGIVLSGGTSQIQNIEKYFTNTLGVPCVLVENPLTAVVEGVQIALNHIGALQLAFRY